MKRGISFILLLCTTVQLSSLFAQPQQLDDKDRQKWMSEVRHFKHEFLARELDLSKEQQNVFFDAYDEMEDNLNRLSTETRELEQRTLADPNTNDVQLDAVARAVYQQKSEEGKIELEYFDRFKNILNPKQLIKLKSAERKFTQQLMMHHRRLKNGEGRRNQ